MKKEIYNLQIVRGIAALIVVAGHLLPPAIAEYIPGQVGVSMFFFLSGYIMLYSFKASEHPVTFLKKRFLRIHPSYLIISLPLIVAALVKTTSVQYMLHTVLLLPWLEWSREKNSFNIHSPIANPVAWTLMFEYYFYAIFTLGKSIRNNRNFVFYFSSIAIVTIMALSNFFLGNDGKLGWTTLSWHAITSNLCNISFIAGMSWQLMSENKHVEHKRPWALLLIPLSIILLDKVSPLTNISNNQIIDLLFSCIPCWIFVAALSTSARLTGRIFDRIHATGQYSYSLYLFHSVLATIIYQLHLAPKYEWPVALVSITLSLWISKYLYKYIESVNVIELVKNGHSRYKKARGYTG